MIKMYYVSEERIFGITPEMKICYGIEQAILMYKFRNKPTDALKPVISASIYEFDLDIEAPAHIPYEELATADVYYSNHPSFSFGEDLKITPVKDLFFTENIRLRSLIHTKTVDEMRTWFDTYCPTDVFDSYIEMKHQLVSHLASMIAGTDPRSIGEEVLENIKKMNALEVELIEEYHALDNQIEHQKELIATLMGFDTIEAARAHLESLKTRLESE